MPDSTHCGSSGRPPCARRRALLGGGALLALAPQVLRSALAATLPAARQPVQIGDELAYPSWEQAGRVLAPADVELHAEPLLAYPRDPHDGILRERSRLNQLLVVRFEVDELDPATRALAADGVLAYSAICTHTACGITGWRAETLELVCPCHESTFDPRRRGARVAGPAPRALPALPLALDGDRFRVAAPFTGAVGAQS